MDSRHVAEAFVRVRVMEFVPKVSVVGVLAPPGQESVSIDKLNYVWSDLAGQQRFTSYNLSPDQTQAVLSGPSDALRIGLPLIQVEQTMRFPVGEHASVAEETLKTVSTRLGIQQFFNLGVKFVYNAQVLNNDARAFILRNLLQAGESDGLDRLKVGGGIWGGVKYVADAADREISVSIEPLHADDMKSLFVDVNAQFLGEIPLDEVKSRVGEINDYANNSVLQYLNSFAL